MLELFARAPDALRPIEHGHLTPIPFDEAVSSLSAILIDDDYYSFIMSGRRNVDDLPWVGEDRLIPLKAIAWLELRARKEQGEPVDSKNIRKHANDVLRLSQLLAAATRFSLPRKIADDMCRFLSAAAADETLDPKAVGISTLTRTELLARITRAYGLDEGSL